MPPTAKQASTTGVAPFQEREKFEKFMLVMKYVQFLFLSVFFYGTALLTYELLQLIPGIILSSWSIGCTIFGAEGTVASVWILRKTERKMAQFFPAGPAGSK